MLSSIFIDCRKITQEIEQNKNFVQLRGAVFRFLIVYYISKENATKSELESSLQISDASHCLVYNISILIPT